MVLERQGELEDFRKVVLYPASENSDHIHEHTIEVNSGGVILSLL